MKPAVFLDRDGTVIELVHHLTDPQDVRLLPGSAAAIARLREKGFECILVTNQSVIGRGLLDVQGLEAVHDTLCALLRAEGAELDGIYFCPVKPEQGDPAVIEHPDRKPGPGMLLRAADEQALDLSRSWMVGDAVSDMLAGRNAGCRGSILVATGYGDRVTEDYGAVDHKAADLAAAAEFILEQS